MIDRFFDRPILNSPYEYPSRHWELDESGQPTSHILDRRRRVSFITPIPRPNKRGQHEMVFDAAAQALENEGQQYDLIAVINELRRRVDAWRSIPDSGRWRVTPETARLLKHRRSHRFKNHGLGLEVPYRFQAESRTYVPDFIVLVDDGHGPENLLRLVVEIKGFRREDAKEKADTIQTYWVPGVNGLGTYGRWDFAEFGDVYTMQADFPATVEAEFGTLVEGVVAKGLPA